jgi:hypothetical protein
MPLIKEEMCVPLNRGGSGSVLENDPSGNYTPATTFKT